MTRSRKRVLVRRLLPFLAAVPLFAGCLDDRADGGTDEVENPALSAYLRDEQGREVAGTVSVFARYHNPTRDSLPLLRLEVPPKGVAIRPEDLFEAMDSAALAGVPWTNRDSLAFNLVGRDPVREAFQADYLLLKGQGEDAWTFLRLEPRAGGSPVDGGSLSAFLPLAPAVTEYRGRVGARGLELGLARIFVPGSPYHAAVAGDGSFAFARLAPGRYEVKAEDRDGKVYTAGDSLATDAAFAPDDWSEADIIWVDD